jgi:uncharacterized membrane protein YccC
MKNMSLLLASVVIFLVGIIFKLINFPGSSILMVLGLAVFILYAAISYTQSKSQVMKKVLIISSIVLLASIAVAMIQHKYFAEILIGAVLAGLIIFLISILFGDKKKQLP